MALRLPAPVARRLIHPIQRQVFDTRVPWSRQRRILSAIGALGRTPSGTTHRTSRFGDVPCEVVSTPGASPTRTVVHAHGGGYTTGSPTLLRSWAAHLSAAAGAEVILVDYRLAPEHPAPAAPRDVRAVWDDVAGARAAEHVVVSGDSAGAGLALGLTQALVAAGAAVPAGLLLICPWLDLTINRRDRPDLAARDALLTPGWLHSCVDAYAADRDPADPQLSPLLGELGGLPPVLVQAASDDQLVVDADHFVLAARDAGTTVTYERAAGLWHDFPVQAGLVAAADRAVAAAATFMAARWEAG